MQIIIKKNHQREINVIIFYYSSCIFDHILKSSFTTHTHMPTVNGETSQPVARKYSVFNLVCVKFLLRGVDLSRAKSVCRRVHFSSYTCPLFVISEGGHPHLQLLCTFSNGVLRIWSFQIYSCKEMLRFNLTSIDFCTIFAIKMTNCEGKRTYMYIIDPQKRIENYPNFLKPFTGNIF